MSTPTHTARCSCGSFNFSSTRAPILQLTCHCAQCRAASGQPFTQFAFFKRAETEMSGATRVHDFTADSGHHTYRESCASCGDLLLDRTDGFPQIIGIVAERIAPPFQFQPRCHVWLESKIVDVTLPEGVKGFERDMV